MTRPTDKEQYLSDFRQELNDCCRILPNGGAFGGTGQVPNVGPMRDLLNRVTLLNRSLRYARIDELLDSEEYRSIEVPLNQLIRLVSQLATQMQSGKFNI